MKATITVKMANAAFEGQSGAELARILRKLADDVGEYNLMYDEYVLMDVNGNKVGMCKVTGGRHYDKV